MTPSKRAAVLHVVESVTREIDGFLSGLAEDRRAEAGISDFYDFIESDELHPSIPPASRKFLIDSWVQRLYGETPTGEEPSSPIEIPGGPCKMIRLVQAWRTSAGKVADQLPALDLEKTSKAIRAELKSLETAPAVPLTRDDRERFPQPEEFRPFLQREERAARVVKVLLEAISAGMAETSQPLATDPERQATPAGERQDPPRTRQQRQYKWLAEAMLLVKEHPDWPDAEIARRVDIDKSRLTRSREYQAAAALARGTKESKPQGEITVDSEKGLHDVDGVARDKPDRGEPISDSNLFREYCSECGEPIRVPKDQVGENPRCEDCQ